MELKKFTVIGIYADSEQRFATSVEAKDADQAEQMVLDEVEAEASERLIIAGTLEGDHQMAA